MDPLLIQRTLAMRKFLFATIFMFLSSNIVFAETLTPDMIKQIHDQVKTSFFEGCSKDLKGSAIDICRCLADKTQASLDDKALSKCNNDDSGKDCVTKAVKDASVKATTKDNVMQCKKDAEAQPSTPANSTNTNSSTTSTTSTLNNAATSTSKSN
jgi:hypothetical protein